MPGFGSAPFGSSGAGLGVPVHASAPPDGPAGSRFIDPVTKDYAIDSTTGQLQQMPPIRQRVLLALTTVLGSATTLPGFGMTFPRKMGDRFEGQVKNAVAAALYQLTTVEKVIRVTNVIVEKGAAGRSRTTVQYVDTSTNTEDQATFRG
jgi:phage baseplate assembly protein W